MPKHNTGFGILRRNSVCVCMQQQSTNVVQGLRKRLKKREFDMFWVLCKCVGGNTLMWSLDNLWSIICRKFASKQRKETPQKAIGRVLKPFSLKHVVRPALCLGYLDAMGNKTELETLSSSFNGQVRAILKIILTHFSILASLLPFNKSWSVNRPTPIKTFLLVKGT